MEDVEEDRGGQHGHRVEDVKEPFVVGSVGVEAVCVFGKTVDDSDLGKEGLLVLMLP